MAKKTDWLPRSRREQLDMARNWLTIFNEAGSGMEKGVPKHTEWNIPTTAVNSLAEASENAGSALADSMNEETRTIVVNARCKSAFETLVSIMRDVKRRCFFMPPLNEADWVALGLRIHDTTLSISGDPTGQVAADTFLTRGRHELGINIRFIKGSPEDKSNKGFRIWYSVVASGESAPLTPENLNKSVYTQRKKDTLLFDYNDSGRTVYLAVQIENGKRKGSWGPMTSSVIP